MAKNLYLSLSPGLVRVSSAVAERLVALNCPTLAPFTESHFSLEMQRKGERVHVALARRGCLVSADTLTALAVDLLTAVQHCHAHDMAHGRVTVAAVSLVQGPDGVDRFVLEAPTVTPSGDLLALTPSTAHADVRAVGHVAAQLAMRFLCGWPPVWDFQWSAGGTGTDWAREAVVRLAAASPVLAAFVFHACFDDVPPAVGAVIDGLRRGSVELCGGSHVTPPPHSPCGGGAALPAPSSPQDIAATTNAASQQAFRSRCARATAIVRKAAAAAHARLTSLVHTAAKDAEVAVGTASAHSEVCDTYHRLYSASASRPASVRDLAAAVRQARHALTRMAIFAAHLEELPPHAVQSQLRHATAGVGALTRLSDLAGVAADGPGLLAFTCVAGACNTFRVWAHDREGRVLPWVTPHHVRVRVTAAPIGCTLPVSVEGSDGHAGVATVSYTVPHTATHVTVTVSVCGHAYDGGNSVVVHPGFIGTDATVPLPLWVAPHPVSAAVVDAGFVFVSNPGGTVDVYVLPFMQTPAWSHRTDGRLPTALCTASADSVFMTDTEAQCVVEMAVDGTIRKRFDVRTCGGTVCGIAAWGTLVAVGRLEFEAPAEPLEDSGSRVLLFNRETSTIVRRFAPFGRGVSQVQQVPCLAFTKDGHRLVVGDVSVTHGARLCVFTLDGQCVATVGASLLMFPVSLCCTDVGTVAVMDSELGGVVFVSLSDGGALTGGAKGLTRCGCMASMGSGALLLSSYAASVLL